MEYKTNNNIVYSCKYHVIWCPKYRRNVLIGEIETRLRSIIETTCSEINVDILGIEIMPDHIHLLIEVDPQYGIHKVVKRIKGISSYHLRKEFCELRTKLPTLWSNSYFVSTAGSVSLETVKQYIEMQKKSQREDDGKIG